ncbi:MAG: tetraacyldisaccharide 4'-kinase, partial [Polyangiaceae bacterium]
SIAARALAAAWGAVSGGRIVRPVTLPSRARVIGVGGALLGGSGKTPFAIVLAEELLLRGLEVAVVGHAYRAHPRFPRIVSPTSDVRVVGDDALFAARRLSPKGIKVIVGPTRRAALEFAAEHASWLIVDGLLQARPAPLARSLLLVDADTPWGNGYCPPAGDLRAPVRALVHASDLVVALGDRVPRWFQPGDAHDLPFSDVDAVAQSNLEDTVTIDKKRVPLSELRDLTCALVLAIARPERVQLALERRGIHPVTTFAFPDHHAPSAGELRWVAQHSTRRIDAWLTTEKCATKLPKAIAGAPVLTLNHALRLPAPLVDWVVHGGAGKRSSGPAPAPSLPSSPAQRPW